ncbi:hypothetical protein PFISCL1PPCAC_20587, partial [Pristionchus fissidentatus]
AYRTPRIGTMARLWLVSVLVVVGLAGVAHSTNCHVVPEAEIADRIMKSKLADASTGGSASGSDACAAGQDWCQVTVKKAAAAGGKAKYSKECVAAPAGATATVCKGTPTQQTCTCKGDNCNQDLNALYKAPTDTVNTIDALEKIGVVYSDKALAFFNLLAEVPVTQPTGKAEATTAAGAGETATGGSTDFAGSLSLLMSTFLFVIRQFV